MDDEHVSCPPVVQMVVHPGCNDADDDVWMDAGEVGSSAYGRSEVVSGVEDDDVRADAGHGTADVGVGREDDDIHADGVACSGDLISIASVVRDQQNAH